MLLSNPSVFLSSGLSLYLMICPCLLLLNVRFHPVRSRISRSGDTCEDLISIQETLFSFGSDPNNQPIPNIRAYFNMLTGGGQMPRSQQSCPPPRQATFAHHYLPPFPPPPRPAQQDFLSVFEIFHCVFLTNDLHFFKLPRSQIPLK